ncbi:MAG: Mut7-C RNAse domain-containing protein [Candidatus Omnitrophica bacterium]|nr:Mut7-C RNAse domain-containing protein [Candidatus Omnitrophota bacterium]
MKFILTKELGRLAKWLRIMGFDAVYFKAENRSLLLIEALRENRIILTRNQKVAKTHGPQVINIKAEDFRGQLRQVLEELKIELDRDKMFSRCVLCNIELDFIEKDKVKERVPEYVFQTQKVFYICKDCGRIYWQGTHWGNVEKILKEIGN